MIAITHACDRMQKCEADGPVRCLGAGLCFLVPPCSYSASSRAQPFLGGARDLERFRTTNQLPYGIFHWKSLLLQARRKV